MSSAVRIILVCIICLLVVIFITNFLSIVLEDSRNGQWDFMIYYYAGEAFNQGLNPYTHEAMSMVSGADFQFKFTYIPMTLEIFRVLPLVEYETGYRIWLSLKLLALGFLIFMWRRFFLENISVFIIIPVAIFAFDSTVIWDIKSGNISIFEQVLLWTAFWAFLKDKRIFFTALVILVSLFKFFPIVFLLLLLMDNGYRSWKLPATGLVLMASLILIDYLINPELFHSFVHNVLSINERADSYNYSMFAFWDDLFISLKTTAFLSYRMVLVFGGYFATTVAVVLISIRGYLRLKRRGEARNKLFNILLLCCVYALILPRFKCYSFILLIPALLYLLTILKLKHLPPIILLFGMIPVATPFFEIDAINRMFHYYPLFLAGMVWLCYIAICFDPDEYAVESHTRPINFGENGEINAT